MNNPADYSPERGSNWDWKSCPVCASTTLVADEKNMEDVYVRVYAVCCNISWVYCWEDDHDFGDLNIVTNKEVKA